MIAVESRLSRHGRVTSGMGRSPVAVKRMPLGKRMRVLSGVDEAFKAGAVVQGQDVEERCEVHNVDVREWSHTVC